MSLDFIVHAMFNPGLCLCFLLVVWVRKNSDGPLGTSDVYASMNIAQEDLFI